MATVIELIKRSYRLIGVYSIGEEPDANESVDALTALNAMLASWANEPQLAYVKTLDSIPLTGGTYTLGPSGTVVTTRPTIIDPSSYIELNGTSYPVKVATLEQYNSIVTKSLTSSRPYALRYDDTYPNGTLTLYPAPNSGVLKLFSTKPLPQFTSLVDSVNLPNGYEDLIVYNLAVRLGAENQVAIPNGLVAMASDIKRKIKRTNYEPLRLKIDIGTRGRYNVFSGT